MLYSTLIGCLIEDENIYLHKISDTLTLFAVGKVALVIVIIALVIALPITGIFTILMLWIFGVHSSYSSGWQAVVTAIFYLFAIGENLLVYRKEYIIGRLVSSGIIFLVKAAIGIATIGPAGCLTSIIVFIISIFIIPIVAAVTFYYFLFEGYLRIAWTALSG